MVKVSFEFGILIRKAALVEKSVERSVLLAAMDTDHPDDENEKFLSFGPHFGGEVADKLSQRLIALGLEYWEDFFETSFDHPPWCEFSAQPPTPLP